MSEQEQAVREMTLREAVERMPKGCRAAHEWEALTTVAMALLTQHGMPRYVAGLWKDDALRAVLDAFIPGRTTR